MKIATAKRGLFEIRDEWLTRPIDDEHVAVLRAVLDEGGDLPPLSVVILESGALGVVDGNHRFAAYAAEKRAAIPYRVVGRGDACIPWWLAAANRDHGKSRGHDEKRLAVGRAIAAPEGADQSNADLARHCGVSVDLVRSVRAEITGATSAAAERRQAATAALASAGDTSERATAAAAGTSRHAVRAARRVVESLATHDSTTESDRDDEPRNVILDPDVPSRPEPPVADAAPLPFEPEWQPIAAASDRLAAAIVAVKRDRSADLRLVPGGQEIADALTRAHGIATRRRPTACPAAHAAPGCPICADRGWTEGEVSEGAVQRLTGARHA